MSTRLYGPSKGTALGARRIVPDLASVTDESGALTTSKLLPQVETTPMAVASVRTTVPGARNVQLETGSG